MEKNNIKQNGAPSEYLSRTSTVFTRLAETMLRFRWMFLALVAGLTIFAFFWALLADFLFAPALMLLIKPLGPERIVEQKES